MKRCLTAVGLLLAAACGSDQEIAAANAAWTAFATALQQGDREAARAAVTADSAVALTALPWSQLRKAPPRLAIGCERTAIDWRVMVQDPSSTQPAQFVVVREGGRFVVDLVATAGLYTEVVAAEASTDQLAPRQLTPADFDRIREFELAKPPR